MNIFEAIQQVPPYIEEGGDTYVFSIFRSGSQVRIAYLCGGKFLHLCENIESEGELIQACQQLTQIIEGEQGSIYP